MSKIALVLVVLSQVATTICLGKRPSRRQCKRRNFTNCRQCTRIGCVWNPSHGFCYERGITFGGEKLQWVKSCKSQPKTKYQRPGIYDCNYKTLTSCTKCTEIGCLWNPSHGFCYDKAYNIKEKEVKWARTCPAQFDHIFSDPLYEAQDWAYDMLNVESVWKQGLTGKGITIQINDSGVDVSHPEFEGRFNNEGSCDEYSPQNGSKHGTNVASIALAAANNGQCATGIAPEATFTACYYSQGLFKAAGTGVDISNNSWGHDACERIVMMKDYEFPDQEGVCPLPKEISDSSEEFDTDEPDRPALNSMECARKLDTYCHGAKEFSRETATYKLNLEEDPQICQKYWPYYVRCEYNDVSSEKMAALVEGIQKGRDGKGIIYVFASGNEFNSGETVNMEGFLRSRYTITVGAVDQSGVRASYSTPGAAALFISGPGGDYEYHTNHIAAKVGGGCHDAKVGTSYATPAVSGGIALMLQANPNLGWRDVQGILAKTARKINRASKKWTTNAAGFSHHPYYGFGVMDVQAAVNAAKTWKNWGEEQHVTVETPKLKNAIIPDADAKRAKVSNLVVPDKGLIAESVVVSLHIIHPSRGQLHIQLISPEGTMTDLMQSNRGDTTIGDESWEMMSLLNWGENPSGKWKLRLSDRVKGHGAGKLEEGATSRLISWSLTVYGHASADAQQMT